MTQKLRAIWPLSLRNIYANLIFLGPKAHGLRQLPASWRDMAIAAMSPYLLQLQQTKLVSVGVSRTALRRGWSDRALHLGSKRYVKVAQPQTIA